MPLTKIPSLFSCHLQSDSILTRYILFCFVNSTKLHKETQHFVRQDKGCKLLVRAKHFIWLIFFGPRDVHSHNPPLPKERILWKHQMQQFTNTCLQLSDTPVKTKVASLPYGKNKVLSMIFELMRQPLLSDLAAVYHTLCAVS